MPSGAWIELEVRPGCGEGLGLQKVHEQENIDFPQALVTWLRVNQAGFPGGASGKELAYQCGRYKRRAFNLRVGKIP